MRTGEVVALSIIGISLSLVIMKMISSKKKDHLGGYGILSGLYFNNNARRCFKNMYDPDWWPGYCETIGTVVI